MPKCQREVNVAFDVASTSQMQTVNAIRMYTWLGIVSR